MLPVLANIHKILEAGRLKKLSLLVWFPLSFKCFFESKVFLVPVGVLRILEGVVGLRMCFRSEPA